MEKDFELFELKHSLIIPDDLKHYFKEFKVEDYDKDMFVFYGFDQFNSIEDEVGDWGAGPDYRNIINTLPRHQDCFVFIDYFCHIYVYAIRLHKGLSEKNEVYVICGDSFKIIANSFNEFLEIYFSEKWDGIFI